MKKIVLSIAGVMAAAAFAPEASAIPSFARQTGMACTACHAQHFPVLNGFGQAFKAAGYTMMGAQEKVEGEHLSIPNVLNASMLFKARYQKTNGIQAAGVTSGATTNSGQWQIPDEFSLFLGGRVAESIGFMFEGNVAAAGALVAGFKMPFVFEMGGAKVGVVAYTTDNLGIGYGFEQTSNGVTRGNRWQEHADWTNAASWVGIGNGSNTGLTFYAKNDMGYINFSRYAPAFTAGGAGTAMTLRSNWLRVAATPNVADWSMIIGAGFASGSNETSGLTTATFDTKATMFDMQAQGELGGKETSFYFGYVNAPASARGNAYNNIAQLSSGAGNHGNGAPAAPAATVTDKKAWNLGVDYTVIPHALSIGANYLSGNTGSAVVGSTDKVNIWTVTAVYDLTQNVALHMNHSSASGSAYDVTTGTLGTPANGKQLTTFMLEAAW